MMEGGRRVNKDTIRGATNTQWIYTTGEGHMCSDSIYEEIIPYDPEIHPRDHREYTGPQVRDTEAFILKARWVQGDGRYGYDDMDYKDTKTKVTIHCPEHGTFQQPPHYHLTGKQCIHCAGARRGKNRKTPINAFIERANQKHGGIYDYSEVAYNTVSDMVWITCPNGHRFQQQACDHLNGRGCRFCNGHFYSLEEFKRKIDEVHGEGKYALTDSFEYKGSYHKIELICRDHPHHIFKIRPNDLFNGYGCPKCGMTGGYAHSVEDMPEEDGKRPAILYHVRATDGNEVFDKIGITVNSIEYRFGPLIRKGFDIKVIGIMNTTLHEAIIIEKQIMTDMAKLGVSHRVHTMKKLGLKGWSECFRSESFDPSSYFKGGVDVAV